MTLITARTKLVQALAEARYWSKRAAGIPTRRRDGSECLPRNDVESTGAEYHAATECGETFNPTISTHGDGGVDFVFGLSVEAIWLGEDKEGQPRREGHLMLNPDEPHRFADIYVSVAGNSTEGYVMLGWTTHKKLVQNPLIDFGMGPRLQMNVNDLYPMEKLLGLKRLPVRS